jgi:hypothetical protein
MKQELEAFRKAWAAADEVDRDDVCWRHPSFGSKAVLLGHAVHALGEALERGGELEDAGKLRRVQSRLENEFEAHHETRCKLAEAREELARSNAKAIALERELNGARNLHSSALKGFAADEAKWNARIAELERERARAASGDWPEARALHRALAHWNTISGGDGRCTIVLKDAPDRPGDVRLMDTVRAFRDSTPPAAPSRPEREVDDVRLQLKRVGKPDLWVRGTSEAIDYVRAELARPQLGEYERLAVEYAEAMADDRPTPFFAAWNAWKSAYDARQRGETVGRAPDAVDAKATMLAPVVEQDGEREIRNAWNAAARAQRHRISVEPATVDVWFAELGNQRTGPHISLAMARHRDPHAVRYVRVALPVVEVVEGGAL